MTAGKRWLRVSLLLIFVALQLGVSASPARANSSRDASDGEDSLRKALTAALQVACGPSQCHVDGINNRAVSAVTKDGTTGAATRVDVDLLDKDGKSISNVAAALASCTQCRSIAVALQAVIVPATVHNIDQILSNTVSLALNCSGCTTAAFSHIVVVASSLANPRLTPAAKAKVDDVERQLSDLDRSLPSDQLIARIDALVTQFDNTIVNGVGPAPRWTRTRTEHRES